ncbi:MAG: N-acetylmuramoyl-L-alanine amidase [Candidatus Hydrogenedentes bacterium]|nr:N-acetylmuramoyl-L-alanine amidase [Candidatus Hydrogenedentota bacterium]
MVAILSALYFAAHAESVTYNAQVGDEARLSTVDIVSVEGQPCVSLKKLLADLGGQLRVNENTVQVSLRNYSAKMTIGDTTVWAAKEFTMQQPPRIFENDIFVAVGDVTALFVYAFNVDIKTGQPDQPGAPSLPSGRKLCVVIDAGHGGADPGASGQGAITEKDIARAIATQVAKLIGQVCQPKFTRSEDESLSTEKRVGIANGSPKGDVLLSVHVGTSNSKTANGFEFFCPLGSSDATAAKSLALARSMSNAMSESTGLMPRGVRQVPCRIFTGLQMPGVLVEVGFITNPTEEQLIANPEHQQKLAQGIANGIIAYATGKTQ